MDAQLTLHYAFGAGRRFTMTPQLPLACAGDRTSRLRLPHEASMLQSAPRVAQ
jgi:hypothetical protein